MAACSRVVAHIQLLPQSTTMLVAWVRIVVCSNTWRWQCGAWVAQLQLSANEKSCTWCVWAWIRHTHKNPRVTMATTLSGSLPGTLPECCGYQRPGCGSPSTRRGVPGIEPIGEGKLDEQVQSLTLEHYAEERSSSHCWVIVQSVALLPGKNPQPGYPSW